MGNMTDQQRMAFFLTERRRGLTNEQLKETVIGLLKESRVNHVLGCAQTAVELAALWGADTQDAYRAGMLHDVTKALDGQLQLTLCEKLGILIDEFAQKNPKTLHATTGAAVAKTVFGENEAVQAAIRSHTTGCGGMSTLQKIIYIADYMEPNRDFDGVQELRRLAETDLDKALKKGLDMSIAVLHQQGRDVCPDSLDALNDLEKEKIEC